MTTSRRGGEACEWGEPPDPCLGPPTWAQTRGPQEGAWAWWGLWGVLQRLLEPRRPLPDQVCSPKAALSCKPSASPPWPRPGARAALAPNGEACDVRG